ncbi:MAG: precorrin-8X methylmutase [Oscillospiraceae bacterium]|nr:precorrin-8X methylmutase [Oscillospiraceae bacterium]
MEIEQVCPADIEKRSFEIITELLGEQQPPTETAHIVKRVIHTTADLDYAHAMYFSENAAQVLSQTLAQGATVVTDTQMALSGINKKALATFGGQVCCFMADEDVASQAKERGVTRASVSMEKAAFLPGPLIFAIGNAPTALLRLEELIREGKITPKLVIGVPVGFVNVIQSKERIMAAGVPCIVARGRKGGSNVAAAIVNAGLYHLIRKE